MPHNETQEGPCWSKSEMEGSLASATMRRSSRDPRRAQEFLLHSLLSGQGRAVDRVAEAFIDLTQAAKRVAVTFRGGGRLNYLGAGSSGLLAMQDELELPGAFGVEAEKIRLVTPNGERLLVDGSAEDDTRLAEEADPLADTAIAKALAQGQTRRSPGQRNTSRPRASDCRAGRWRRHGFGGSARGRR